MKHLKKLRFIDLDSDKYSINTNFDTKRHKSHVPYKDIKIKTLLHYIHIINVWNLTRPHCNLTVGPQNKLISNWPDPIGRFISIQMSSRHKNVTASQLVTFRILILQVKVIGLDVSDLLPRLFADLLFNPEG